MRRRDPATQLTTDPTMTNLIVSILLGVLLGCACAVESMWTLKLLDDPDARCLDGSPGMPDKSNNLSLDVY
jgi:hypothetical protein